MSLTFWEPFRDDLFPSAMRMLANASNDAISGQPANYGRGILLDIKETRDNFDVKADIPGVAKDAIQVTADNDVLTIKIQQESKKDDEKEEKGVKYHRSERSSLYVSRSIRMPDTADLSQIKAKYQDGTLHLDIPKIPDEKRTLTVAIE